MRISASKVRRICVCLKILGSHDKVGEMIMENDNGAIWRILQFMVLLYDFAIQHIHNDGFRGFYQPEMGTVYGYVFFNG